MKRIYTPLLLGFFCILNGCASMGTEAKMKDPEGNGPISRILKDNKSLFEQCISQSVSLNSGEGIHILTTVTITPSGKVIRPEIEEMSAPDPDFGACIQRKFTKLVFPAPTSGKSQKVQIPLHFIQPKE